MSFLKKNIKTRLRSMWSITLFSKLGEFWSNCCHHAYLMIRRLEILSWRKGWRKAWRNSWNNFKHKIFRRVLISMQYYQCVIITRHFWRNQKKKKNAHKNKILINHISFGTQKYILKKTKIYLELQRYIDMLQLFGIVVWHQRKNNKDYLLLFRTK